MSYHMDETIKKNGQYYEVTVDISENISYRITGPGMDTGLISSTPDGFDFFLPDEDFCRDLVERELEAMQS